MIYKRGEIYWTKFQHQGQMIYRSSGQTSRTKARQVEARLRSELALGHYGILEQKPIPTLGGFIKDRIEPKVKEPDSGDQQRRQKRFKWLCTALKPLSSAAIGRLPLDKLTSESVSDYSIHRESEGLSIGTINRELRVLRRVLRLAVEWNVLEKSPKVSMAGNEPFRVRVVGDSEFERYLLNASRLLSDVATILHDSGLRPDELHRLCWEDISFETGRYGALSVRSGKTAAARRTLPMTARVRCIIEARWLSADEPTVGWIFPAPSKSGHITHSSLKKAHAKTLKLSAVQPFLLYSLRHTFATRLATSPGMDAWTLCKIMGWSSLAVAMRYIHPDESKVLEAFGQSPELQPTGDKTGDIAPRLLEEPARMIAANPTAAVV
jgi:integrase